jgi:hypothetical protein
MAFSSERTGVLIVMMVVTRFNTIPELPVTKQGACQKNYSPDDVEVVKVGNCSSGEMQAKLCHSGNNQTSRGNVLPDIEIPEPEGGVLFHSLIQFILSNIKANT